MNKALSHPLAITALTGALLFSAGVSTSPARTNDFAAITASSTPTQANRSALLGTRQARGGDYLEDFDSYTLGSEIIGQGGWEGWAGDPNVGALVDDDFSVSTPHSLNVVATTDVVHPFTGFNSGSFTISARQYIPTAYTGESYFILQNTYPSTANQHWSVQLKFNAVTGLIESDGQTPENPVSFVRDEWAEIRVEVDLDTDTQTIFYNDEELYTASWANDTAAGGALNLGAIDLFGNGGTSVYYDDIAVIRGAGAPFAVELSADPTSASAAPGSTVTYTFTVNNTGTDDDTYDIAATGVWTATPSVTSLAVLAGESGTFDLDVEIPGAATIGDDDVTTVTATSTGDPSVEASVDVTTTAAEGKDCIFADGFEEGGTGSCPGGAVGEPGVYDNRDDFLANVLNGNYEDDFADVPTEDVTTPLLFDNGGFSYSVFGAAPYDPGPPATGGLYNGPGFISLNSASDQIVVTFTSGNITAVGGNFWATDLSFGSTGTSIILDLSDGTTETITVSSPSSFVGFVTESPITTLTIEAPDVPANAWPTMDNLIVGAR